MDGFSDFFDLLWRVWAYLTTGRVLASVLGVGFALLAVLLWIASRTKWGQTKPLTKCVVLSVLLHIWLLMYAIGSPKVLPQGSLDAEEQNNPVSFEPTSVASRSKPADSSQSSVENQNDLPDAAAEPQENGDALAPWEEPVPLAQLPKPPVLENFDLSGDLAPALLPALTPTPMPALPPPEPLADLNEPEATSADSPSHDSSAEILAPVLPVEPLSDDATASAATEAATLPPAVAPTASNSTANSNSAADSSAIANAVQPAPTSSVMPPREYQLRQAANRLQLAQAYGADADSEAAVEAALAWLAAAQAADGSWNAAQHGAGEERFVLGESRHGTGDKADTGVSGLALLAFLSGGHTHQRGEYQANVAGGLQYLLRAQMPSGDLSGPKQVGSDWNVLNARMYCHSIATLALAEAYAMTRDAALREGLLRAVQYSINAQDVRGGGWRYRPRDPGDLSQFGWQALALKSVERSGIQIPSEVKRRMRRFLDSCAAGQFGGLATYRPRSGRPSDTMTAEALACRLLWDYPLSTPAQAEATTMIMVHRPQSVSERRAGGVSDGNVYFWYYATLALFQLQDENWRVWNQALKARLLSTQVPSYGEEPGSWNPDTLWAGYGGRVYSTAMSCLCLEVYYRYLPMYGGSSVARTPPPNLPANLRR